MVPRAGSLEQAGACGLRWGAEGRWQGLCDFCCSQWLRKAVSSIPLSSFGVTLYPRLHVILYWKHGSSTRSSPPKKTYNLYMHCFVIMGIVNVFWDLTTKYITSQQVHCTILRWQVAFSPILIISRESIPSPLDTWLVPTSDPVFLKKYLVMKKIQITFEPFSQCSQY